MLNSFAMVALGKIAVIERDRTYQSCSAMLSAGGIRQQFSVPENIQMSIYGADFLKNMDALGVYAKQCELRLLYITDNLLHSHLWTIQH